MENPKRRTPENQCRTNFPVCKSQTPSPPVVRCGNVEFRRTSCIAIPSSTNEFGRKQPSPNRRVSLPMSTLALPPPSFFTRRSTCPTEELQEQQKAFFDERISKLGSSESKNNPFEKFQNAMGIIGIAQEVKCSCYVVVVLCICIPTV